LLEGFLFTVLPERSILSYENHDFGRQFLIKLGILPGRSWDDKRSKRHQEETGLQDFDENLIGGSLLDLEVQLAHHDDRGHRKNDFRQENNLKCPAMEFFKGNPYVRGG
jgi:hypothetical protein